MAAFKDRIDAGKRLAKELRYLKGEPAVVYALPRGGVPLAKEVADELKAPLDLLFAHKVGHPFSPEYAVAAISESGDIVAAPHEVQALGKAFIEKAAEEERLKMKAKRNLYLKGRGPIDPEGKVAIVVDDGIATGLTLEAALVELKNKHPKRIILAVPAAPEDALDRLSKYTDENVCLIIAGPGDYLGSVGAYYDHFGQTSDEEVTRALFT
ncbi:MAG: phosphoribosyl transferase [Chlamydiia bacterium]|nr:phosphoribosyl transferase [Chlamydiia bacterium]